MLTGRTVLVLESEFIIAMGVQAVLESLGNPRIILATSVHEAHAVAAQWSNACLAIVELEMARPDLIELARQISQSGIPVLGLSADPRLAFGAPELPGTPVVIKPLPDEDLRTAIADRLNQNPLPDVT